ncbi:4'-phosphopantetheinyl transferase family protein [Streptomyces roseoverticillatus]|uniref:4'-phosphopantetheinyl transferase family protein n=1 Tax=Streptomyces roseoverticillatus TaxID=66429 RepID=UPI0022855B9A|nr:4'-phosphopantetheinyl transferase superfamily protein [Streptomyces roseoverticillatus]
MGVSGGPGIRPGVLGEDPLPGVWTPGRPHVWLMRLDGLRPSGFVHDGPGAGGLPDEGAEAGRPDALTPGGPADSPSGGGPAGGGAPRGHGLPGNGLTADGPGADGPGADGPGADGPGAGDARAGDPRGGRGPGGLPDGGPANGDLPGPGPVPGAGGLPANGLPGGGLRAPGPLDAALRDYERILDPAERSRAAAFVRDLHRDRYIASHVGLRLLLGAYLGTDPAAVVLVREPCPGCGGPHGRPAAAGAPLHFNLSHAGDLALFAFADTPVGVDVEQLQPADVVEDVARVLHPDETAELAALPAQQRPEAFARCWTRKEAYLKGTGTGLSENPSVTYVGSGPAPASPAGWTLSDVEAVPGYAAAVAVANARRPRTPHGR